MENTPGGDGVNVEVVSVGEKNDECSVMLAKHDTYATWAIMDTKGKISSTDSGIIVFDRIGKKYAQVQPLTLAHANLFSDIMIDGPCATGVRLLLDDAEERLRDAEASEAMLRRFSVARERFISYKDQ